MYFDLLENALDSLNYGLKFYNLYLKDENRFEFQKGGELKLAVICIHHAVEILNKKILSDIN